VNAAHDVTLRNNRLSDFAELGEHIEIEPPNGYWGFGRDRVGINVENGSQIRLIANQVVGLSTETPVGIRITNSRFTTDREIGCYSVTDSQDPEGIDLNSNNEVRDNLVEGEKGMRIGYYIENQKDLVFRDNRSSNCSANRIIACTGEIVSNDFLEPMCVVGEATAACPRLIMPTHHMHPNGIPVGPCGYQQPAPESNQYFYVRQRMQ